MDSAVIVFCFCVYFLLFGFVFCFVFLCFYALLSCFFLVFCFKFAKVYIRFFTLSLCMHTTEVNGGRVSSKALAGLLSNSKKGQVTIFIIVGLVLLISVALILVLRSEVVSFGAEATFSTDKGKVENFVTACIQGVGEEALYIAGLQGGYIEVPERFSEDINWHLPLSDFMDVPLWAYGNLEDRPSIDVIKNEIDSYIEENVRDCLFESDAFSVEYDLTENSDIFADTQFLDSKTEFNVRWNLLIMDKSGETVAEVIEHVAESSVPFKSMYDSASLILDAELDELKLEDLTQDMIAMEHEDLPVVGTELSCSKKQWSASTAEDTLKEMLRVNMRNLRVEGTQFVSYGDLEPYYQNHYEWGVDGVDDDDLSVVFRYESNYPFTFQVTPRSGDKMMSNQLGGQDLLNFVCIQNWKFTYDAVFPVLVQVTDDASGVTLQYAVSVHLLSNYGNRGGQVYARESEFAPTSNYEEEFCLENSYTVPMTVFTNSLVENSGTGVYATEPLSDVNLSYTCLKYTCDLGVTEYDFEGTGNAAGMTQLFPYCAGGIVSGEKEGYLGATEFVPAVEGTEVNLNLRPLYSFSVSDISIIKHRLDVDTCRGDDEPDKNGLCVEIAEFEEEMDEDETALVTLKLFAEDVVGSDVAGGVEASDSEEGSDSGEEGSGESGESTESEDSYSEEELDILGVFDNRETLHEEKFIYTSLESEDEDGLLSDAFVNVLSEANFEYEVDIIITTDEYLMGGYDGKWMIDSSLSTKEGRSVVFHVLELDPSDENYYLFLSDLEYYSELIGSPEVVAED